MESPRQLRRICQAGKESAPAWYAMHRRISIYLTWFLLHARATPNQVSLLMLSVGLAGSGLLVAVHPGLNVLGLALLYTSFLLDKVDGEIARYRRAESLHGMLLDRLHHRLVEPMLFAAVAVREYRTSSSCGVLVAGLVTILVANIIEEHQHLSTYLFCKHVSQTRTLPAARTPRLPSPLRWLLALFKPLKGLRMFILALPLVALAYGAEWATGWPAPTYYLYASAALLSAYLIFQCPYYFFYKLDEEIAAIEETIGLLDAPDFPETRATLPRPGTAQMRSEEVSPLIGVQVGGNRVADGPTHKGKGL